MKNKIKMKRFLSILIVGALLFISISGHAQNIDGVISGLKQGNAVLVTDNSGDNLLLTIMDKSNTNSKAQALQILKEFFNKNSVKNFELKHKGDSPNGRYAIGTLITANGNYRVNIFMKMEGQKEVIKELRFQLIE